jgi:hypothetical protein
MLNFRLKSMEDLKLEDDEAAAPTSFGVGPLLSFLSNRELGTLGRLQVKKFLNPFCFTCTLYRDSPVSAVFWSLANRANRTLI